MQRTLITLILSLAFTPVFATETLCTKFNPAQNKEFVDTYGLNFLTISRANTKVSGQFTHDFGNGNIQSAPVKGICTGNQMSFNWRQGKFNGQFSGTLTCINNIYNLVNIIAVIDGVSVFMNAMVSPAGTCP